MQSPNAISENNNDNDDPHSTPTLSPLSHRRIFLQSTAIAAASLFFISQPASAAAPRAVGSGEAACRTLGNCWETGEWDGAVGWQWGGKDRCDATDPLCGPNGQVRSTPLVGQPVPTLPVTSDNDTSNPLMITHVVALRIQVGREESGILRLGLYGSVASASVVQLVAFLSTPGLVTLPNAPNELGRFTAPVTLTRGGVVSTIVPHTSVTFGVASQTYAYARSRGLSKVDLVVQPRPSQDATRQDGMIRPHECAGLVSVPRMGLGYGGTGFESDDEAYDAAFLITAAGDKQSSLDANRRVIGQVLDASSMAFLERLASLPTQRGIRGVIPGQTSGPPLIKTVVQEIVVDTVRAS
jgi:hypothetical protein